jgi:uncharacterized BrkB/YihY/UPF0761 family membrane protein
MSTPPSNDAAAGTPRQAHKRTIVGLICFGLGLLVVAGAVIVMILSLIEANPIGLVPGILGALVGIALNFTGLVLLYRALTGATAKNRGGSDVTP